MATEWAGKIRRSSLTKPKYRNNEIVISFHGRRREGVLGRCGRDPASPLLHVDAAGARGRRPPQAVRARSNLPTRVDRLFSSSHAGVAVQIRQLWSGKQPVPTKSVRNVKRFRRGLVFEAHRLLYHSTLDLRVIKKKKKTSVGANRRSPPPRCGRSWRVTPTRSGAPLDPKPSTLNPKP